MYKVNIRSSIGRNLFLAVRDIILSQFITNKNMYFLILWSDSTTSVVTLNCVKFGSDGTVTATLNGTDFYKAIVLRRSTNKKYLHSLGVDVDGNVYTAKRNLLSLASSRVRISFKLPNLDKIL